MALMPQAWGQLDGLEDLGLGVVGLEELGDVDQIAAVGPAADEVAAQDEAGSTAPCRSCRRAGCRPECWGRNSRTGSGLGLVQRRQQAVLFLAQQGPGPYRSQQGLAHKAATIGVLGHFSSLRRMWI